MRLIDADAFVESIKGVEVTWYLDGNYETYDDTTIMDIIEEQPPVEAVPAVHGEWINTDGYDEWTCSECGQEENCDDYPTEYGINFCSRCGADMRKKVRYGKESEMF